MIGWSLLLVISYGESVTSILLNNFTTQANAQAVLLALKTSGQGASDANIVSGYTFQIS